MPRYDWLALDDVVQRMMDVYKFPGVSLGVAQHGEVLLARGYGFRDREASQPATERTVYGIGSVTKSFTAASIVQLAESGKLALDDPVKKYLPEFKFGKRGAGDSMLIHHFLTHTSGIPPLPTLFPSMLNSMLKDKDLEGTPHGQALAAQKPLTDFASMLEFIAGLDEEALAPPGQIMSYCNDAYALLGTIIERVSGQKYDDYVHANILRPLGMQQSAFAIEKLDGHDDITTIYAAKPGSPAGEVVRSPVWWESPAMLAAGFLKSNVLDMLKYLEMYRLGGTVNGRELLSKKGISRMIGLHTKYGPVSFYGYGLSTQPNYHGVSLVGHSGGLKGISAHVYLVPEKGLTVCVLCHLSGVPANLIALAAVNTMLGLPARTKALQLPDYSCPVDRLSLYTGEYRSGEAARIVVSQEGDNLVVESSGQRLPARAVGVDTFCMKDRETDMVGRFLMDVHGDYWALELGSRVVRKVK